MARFWIADLHLGHAKIADIRGFGTVKEHDAHLLAQLGKLSLDDEVWVLGDISSGRPEAEERALDLLRGTAPATMHLIAGNHDSVSSIHRNGHKHQARWLEVFASVQQFGRVRLHRQDVLMSHYPYARSGDGPERGPGRYDEYRLPDAGFPLIHGHTHQHEPHMEAGNLAGGFSQDTSQFCVSWDAQRQLATEHDLTQWIQARNEGESE